MSTIEATQSPANSTTSKEAWVKRGIHRVTLPSGAVVKIKFPDLSRMLRNDALPENLRAIALRQAFNDLDMETPAGPMTDAQRKEQEEERLKLAREVVEMVDALIMEMLVDPVMTKEEVAEIPGEDRDMLNEIAQRERNTDALGVRLGVAPLSLFHEFREQHGCLEHEPEGCEACQKVQQRLSSVDLGGV